MSRSIASYPKDFRQHVISRRMRQYDPKGNNGIGVLAAHDYYIRHLGAAMPSKKRKESPSDLKRRENRHLNKGA